MKAQYDVVIIGGGINGAGIAADAALRGLSVMLCEQDDLASYTSSWSSKLIHGGLRYLAQYRFKQVRQSLQERAILLNRAPHLVHPLMFALPDVKGMRPVGLMRLGLWLYDHMALPHPEIGRARRLSSSLHSALTPEFQSGFVYPDCQVDDSRLVIANAQLAASNGADIRTNHRLVAAQVNAAGWLIDVLDRHTKRVHSVRAQCVVNATGPWVDSVRALLSDCPSMEPSCRPVKGSHLLVRRWMAMQEALTLPTQDGRVVFVIPYLHDLCLIGTTDCPYEGDLGAPSISNEEQMYLIEVVARFCGHTIKPKEIIATYSGIRPLWNAPASSLKANSREAVIEHDVINQVPVYHVYGGKITSYRALAEQLVDRLSRYFSGLPRGKTKDVCLPGGQLDQPWKDWLIAAQKQYHWLPPLLCLRYCYQYGSAIHQLLDGASQLPDLGQYFSAGLYEKEVQYVCANEWARTSEDILYRRTKLCWSTEPVDLARLEAYCC